MSWTQDTTVLRSDSAPGTTYACPRVGYTPDFPQSTAQIRCIGSWLLPSAVADTRQHILTRILGGRRCVAACSL